MHTDDPSLVNTTGLPMSLVSPPQDNHTMEEDLSEFVLDLLRITSQAWTVPRSRKKWHVEMLDFIWTNFRKLYLAWKLVWVSVKNVQNMKPVAFYPRYCPIFWEAIVGFYLLYLFISLGEELCEGGHTNSKGICGINFLSPLNGPEDQVVDLSVNAFTHWTILSYLVNSSKRILKSTGHINPLLTINMLAF